MTHVIRPKLLAAALPISLVLALAGITMHASAQTNSGPDLTLQVSHGHGIPFGPGSSFHLHVELRNSGDEESATATLRYYRSEDTVINTSDKEVGADKIDTIEAGDSVQKSIRLTAPSTAGSYHYGACVDSVPGESDATNNCSAATTLDVPEAGPNLVAWVASASDGSPPPSGSLTLSIVVANHGNEDADATTLRYYRGGRNSVILTPISDTELGTSVVDALVSGAANNSSFTLTAPPEVGFYFYYACADTVTDEAETGDNCQLFPAVLVTVTNTPATGIPVTGGTAQAGLTLTADTSGISDADGLENVSYSYQWLADGVEIDGATNKSYTVQASANGKVITVRASFIDDTGSDESLTSEGTSPVVVGGL